MNLSRLGSFVALLTVGSSAWANHDDLSRRREEPRVILYENAGYRGDSLVIYGKEAVVDLERGKFSGGRRINDRVSSVRVEGGAVLLAYEHAGFGGQIIRVTENIPNLADRGLADVNGSWNDRISSLRVETSGRGRDERRGKPDQIDFDKAVTRAYEDVLMRAPDQAGFRYYRSLMIDQGWTEQMVRTHLRKSEEFRGPVINKMIERAYQDVLGRQPDAAGLAQYRLHLLNQGMTEQSLRDALRRSDEFKNRAAPTKIKNEPQSERRVEESPRVLN